jgi:hypothetical protein
MKNFERKPQEEMIGPEPTMEGAGSPELNIDKRSSQEIIEEYEGKGWHQIDQSDFPTAIINGKNAEMVKTADGEQLFFEK